MAITLPDLPYDCDALEPLVSSATLKLHRSAHHCGYVEKLHRPAHRRLEPPGARRAERDPGPAERKLLSEETRHVR
jgi:superoxide dismutase